MPAVASSRQFGSASAGSVNVKGILDARLDRALVQRLGGAVGDRVGIAGRPVHVLQVGVEPADAIDLLAHLEDALDDVARHVVLTREAHPDARRAAHSDRLLMLR